jgi:GAF domain-containing protein
VDHQEKLLRSFIAQGVDEFEIRLPIGHGLAGTVAGTGMPLDVTDVHKDRRFQADFDDRLAYQTKDVFCLPVFNREGTIVGVLELLNRAKPLSAEDKEFLSDMCTYLGVALQNAWAHRQLSQIKDRHKLA